MHCYIVLEAKVGPGLNLTHGPFPSFSLPPLSCHFSLQLANNAGIFFKSNCIKMSNLPASLFPFYLLTAL